jgi:Na+-translocating ferredoxin:NAD+ oxidoreductase RnfG subunit
MQKFLTIVVIILFTACSTFVFGQNIQRKNDKNINKPVKNEIRLNVLTSMLGLLDLNYERFLSDNSGLGIATNISLENKELQTIRSMILPYFRVYFGDEFATGGFIEANMAVAREYYPEYGMAWNSRVYKYQTTFGLGTAIGYKMVRRNGFVGELSLGVGRLFGNSYAELYPRLGISIGKRW